VVDSYEDHAVGFLDQDEQGRLAMTRIELRPAIAFAGAAPGPAELAHIHHLSHEKCYVANSLRADIIVVEG
jgi:organic hydroperoxide reductase OsmC/OhrA